MADVKAQGDRCVPKYHFHGSILIGKVVAVEVGPTGCSQCWAHQFRVLLSAAAYILIQEAACTLQALTTLVRKSGRSANAY